MELFFRVLKRAKPGKKSSDGMVYYPYPNNRKKYTLEDLVQSISSKSTLSSPDIHATVIALIDEIIDHTGSGDIVDIEDLGTFKLNLKSELQDSEEDVSAKCIKGNHLVFIPSTFIKKRLKYIKYRKARKKDWRT